MSNALHFETAEGKNIINTANAMADAAREAILPLFRSRSLVAENKTFNGFDPVTDADKSAERAMITEFCLLYTSPSPRDLSTSRMPSSA